MNTLRKAVQEYLTVRRALGFKLREVGTRLLDFVTFMEQHRASCITHQLAAKMGATALDRSAVPMGTTAELRARLCALSQRH